MTTSNFALVQVQVNTIFLYWEISKYLVQVFGVGSTSTMLRLYVSVAVNHKLRWGIHDAIWIYLPRKVLVSPHPLIINFKLTKPKGSHHD